MVTKRETCKRARKPHQVVKQGQSTTSLLSLPDEVILHILHQCPASSLLHLSQTNQKLRTLSLLPELWESLCRLDFGISIPPTTDARLAYLQLFSVLGSQTLRTDGTPWLSSCRVELHMRENRIVWTNCRTNRVSSLKCERRRDMFCVEMEQEGVRLRCLIQEREHNCRPVLGKTEDNRVFFSSNCLIPIVGCSQYFI